MRRISLRALVLLVTACGATEGAAAARGVVAAATPEAAAAGSEILRAGGNAIDAAVAVAFALGVTEPAGSGLGGQAILLVHPPGGKPFVLNGSTRAPRSTPPEVGRRDLLRRRASTVPSLVRVMDFAWRSHGSGKLGWPELLAPAARLADEGFALGPFRHAALARYAAVLREDATATSELLAEGGALPEVGSLTRRPLLARTLRRLARAGAADFYDGELARAIADDMAEHGGWISLEELASFPEPPVLPPLEGSYRGWTVYSLPPPAGGWVVIQTLHALEHAAPAALAMESPSRAVWLAEALRIAHRSRRDDPVRDLVDYEKGVARRIRKQTLRPVIEELRLPGRGETTHFCVVDADGMVVSATLSLNAYFGARVMHPRLGFLYNDYMREFQTQDPAHPFALRPGGRPYSSMSATILARDGEARLALGSPGSRRIISAVVQVVSGWTDAGLDVASAVAAPRLHVVPETNALFVERRPDSRALLRDLERRGFRVALPLGSLARGEHDPYFGGVHAVAFDEKAGWRGAADPRRDGGVRYVESPGP
jgi:gamma-glutamyltranspeptidase/glutathione hydrolase